MGRPFWRDASGAEGASRLTDLQSLLVEHPQAWTLVRQIIASAASAGGRRLRRPLGGALRRGSEHLARSQRRALLARLAAAPLLGDTRSGALWQRGLLGLERTVLDIGCGIGRLEAALSPLSAAVVGIDISAGMIAQACARCAGFPNVRLLLGSGHDLAGIADGSVDLTVLVDAFPYILLAEGRLAERYLTEISRVSRPGGDVLILKFSHRGDVAADRAGLERLAEPRGLSLAAVTERPCASWDAPAFHLIKRAPGPDRRQ